MRHEIFWFFFSFFEGGGTVNLESTICCKNLVLILTELWVQLHTPCGFFSYFYKWEIRGVNTAGKEGLQGKFVNPTARKFGKTEGKIKTETRLRNFKSQITPLPLFLSTVMKLAGLQSQFQSLDFQPKIYGKKGTFLKHLDISCLAPRLQPICKYHSISGQ